jgi:deazaflavin-dependent oxidoreductase (nitroreductase family)
VTRAPAPADSPVKAVGDHARRYAATGGADGHDWNGAPVLLLSAAGRRTGTWHRTPLIYGQPAEGDCIVVASALGAPAHPAWYLNLAASPRVTLQVRDEVFPAVARTVTGPGRQALWDLMAGIWPPYLDYQATTTRLIPVVALTRP